MGKFQRGWFNVVHLPWVKSKLEAAVKARLLGRVESGLAVGRPRRGEIAEGDGYRADRDGGWVRHSSRRYVGLDRDGEEILKGRREGMTEREIASRVRWPRSTIHSFLMRNKARLTGDEK